VDLWLGLSYCNGKWNKVIIKKEGSILSASVNEQKENASKAGAQPLVVNSLIYVGGIPQELWSSYGHLSLEQGKFSIKQFTSFYSSGPTRFGWFCVLRHGIRLANFCCLFWRVKP
jgi:hypothetical protein